MKIPVAIIGLSILLSVADASAACRGNSTTLFSCMTKKGKQIEVCDTGRVIKYSYGKPARKPEKAVTVLREQVSTSQWSGTGRYISYAIDIPAGNTVYNVFYATDRVADDHSTKAGVNVYVNDSLASTSLCSGENITSGLEGANFKPSRTE